MLWIIGITSILLYIALVYYVGWSIYRGFNINANANKWVALLYILCFGILSFSFILSRFGDGSAILQIMGNYWLAAFCILLMILPFIHLIMLLLRLSTVQRKKVKLLATIAATTVVIVFMGIGTYLAYTPKVTSYEVALNQSAQKSLKAVMISDTHFGYLSGINHAERLVSKINELEPDIVLFPGDIIDDNLEVVEEKNIFSILSGIKSKYGVYASLGNHDKYRGQMDRLITAIESANMNVLYDESVLLNDELYIVGRKDQTDELRLTAAELVKDLDHSKPMIVLDHQPTDFNRLMSAGADLVVSGHTHKGQIFPGSLVTSRLFENDYGYLKKGDMHTIVSSGYGFWGPPIRIASQSEIVLINIKY